jgi:hypothetical protein
MELRFLKISVVYLVLGGALGVVMGMRESFALASVHSHLLLLGWASLALAGLVYHSHPAAAATRLARGHFWLHNVGLPAFMIGLVLLLGGNDWARPLVGGAAAVVMVGLALFAANVLLHLKGRPA